jgi:type I restriction enzyme R subunit
LIEQGIDPDDIDYSGADIEITVSNRDTLVKQWEEFMEVCFKDQSSQLPGKSILETCIPSEAKNWLRTCALVAERYMTREWGKL